MENIANLLAIIFTAVTAGAAWRSAVAAKKSQEISEKLSTLYYPCIELAGFFYESRVSVDSTLEKVLLVFIFNKSKTSTLIRSIKLGDEELTNFSQQPMPIGSFEIKQILFEANAQKIYNQWGNLRVIDCFDNVWGTKPESCKKEHFSFPR